MTAIPRRVRYVQVALALTALAACSGCAVTTAAVVSSAAGAAPVVAERFGDGRTDSFWLAYYEDVVEATLRAGEALSLTLEEKDVGEDRATLRFADPKDTRISISIERQTKTVTRVRFDLGSSRNEGFGLLFGRQIIDELTDAEAFLADWSDEPNPKTELR